MLPYRNLAIISIWLQACWLSSVLSNIMHSELITELHNQHRSNLAAELNISNMNKLIWSETMAEQARSILYRISRNRWRPLANFTEEELNYNFGWTDSQENPIGTILAAWKEEKRVFVRNEKACSPVNRCRNFRHMMNAQQASVGCFNITIRNTTYHIFVCSYRGSIHDIFDFEYGPVCSSCESPASFCDNNLCAACSQAEQQTCDCRKTCTAANLTAGVLGRQTCTCSCHFNTGPNCDRPCQDQTFNEEYNFCELATVDDCQMQEMRQQCPLSCGFCNRVN
ncbi:SCP domain-containing protein 1 [Biomphalaria pfeifferi]|uniref:SCP domain-containing protein 1 n=1 Tax=Biomphalaria pfeifferi TaxID=112525 RepID=A0AAD8B4L9_BIOPF|nr:SCP domain-containing protein 1 [Biomphalaria pfeifferi]